MATVIKVAPDGGYGWVIVFAMGLNHFVMVPLYLSYGLIFKDSFVIYGLTGFEGSLVINLNSAFGMLVGLIIGVMLKIWGYRKVAFFGASCLFFGVLLTAFATTFTQFMICYGLITSLGLGLLMSAYNLAVSTYFLEKRNKAMGIALALTSLGSVVMPQVMDYLLKFYSIRGVTIILSALMSHAYVAAMLLQPVEWHMIKKVINEDKKAEDETLVQPRNEITVFRSISQTEEQGEDNEPPLNIDHDVEINSIYGVENFGSMLSIRSASGNTASRRMSSASSSGGRRRKISRINKSREQIYNELSKPVPKKSKLKGCWSSFSNLFDLDLFKDPIYLNIMIGMSLAIFAETNFSVLTAFILNDIGLSTGQIATFMSVMGIADITFRFLAPYIGDLVKQTPRVLYAGSLFLLIVTRFLILMFRNYEVLLGIALMVGTARGIRSVYMSLVMPTYVPLEKLPSASGIQMMVNGLFLLTGGSVLGVVRDLTGSYDACIIIMNCVTFTTVCMWTVEALILRCRKKPKDIIELTDQNDSLLQY